MDSGHGNGRSKNASAEAESISDCDPFQPFVSLGDFEHEEQSRRDSDSITEGVTHDGTENSKSSDSAASSSSESYSTTADFFPLNPILLTNSENIDPETSPQPEGDIKQHRKDVKSDVSIAALFSLERIYGSSHSISPGLDVTHESPVPLLSQTQSPPVQAMERSGGYDPDRIPASIFTSKCSTPMEWSSNSNDSLFSIHIGHSLPRDQFAIASVDSRNLEDFHIPEESYKWNKSGELRRSKELRSADIVKISDQVTILGQSSPAAKEEEEDKPKKLDLGKHRVVLTDQVKNIPYRSFNLENENGIQHSDEDGANIQSSAFPTKKKSSKKSFCLCSSCSWGSGSGCCSKRPRLCCNLRSCFSCCSKCHCSNWSWFCCCSGKSTKGLSCCCSSSSKASNDERRNCCSCSCCCPCCSSCSYSCC